MTHREGNLLILKEEKPQQCDLCGKIEELRPYGPNGECVCFDCGMKDETACKRALLKRLCGQALSGNSLEENRGIEDV